MSFGGVKYEKGGEEKMGKREGKRRIRGKNKARTDIKTLLGSRLLFGLRYLNVFWSKKHTYLAIGTVFENLPYFLPTFLPFFALFYPIFNFFCSLSLFSFTFPVFLLPLFCTAQ
jgi:hypothetical protein